MLPNLRTLADLSQVVASARDPFTSAMAGAHNAATSDWNALVKPTAAQARAGNYPLGTVHWNGLVLRIENPAHSIREGVGEDGRPWRNLILAHYGYISGTKGADGDGVDVFLGPHPESRKVWVLNQTATGGAFDEHKVLLGFHDERAAVDAYRLSYSPGWDRFGPAVRLSLEQLRWWLQWADTTRPLSIDLLPPEREDMSETTAPDLVRVFWDSTAMPLCGLTLADVLYGIRRSDAQDGLLLDPMTLGELLDGAEVLHLDALITMAGRLQPRMQAMYRVMEVAAGEVKPVAMQISEPVKRYGGVHVAALFELSDGQTITVWFHNPDSTPSRISPADTLVSWKWLLNKKDITIVVAPESGQDLNLREVARRIMRLAEKNSAAFAKANANRAARMAEIEGLQVQLTQRQALLASLHQRIEVAKLATAEPFAAQGGRTAQEIEAPVPVEEVAAADMNGDEPAAVANATPAAAALLAVSAKTDGPSAYRTVLAVNDRVDVLGLSIAWDAIPTLPPAVPKMDDASGGVRFDRADGGSVMVNVFQTGDKVVDIDSGTDLVVTHQLGFKVYCRGSKAPWVHANRLRRADGAKPPRIVLDSAQEGAYLNQDRKGIAAAASLLRWLREFVRSDKELARNPLAEKFGFMHTSTLDSRIMTKADAQRFLTKLVDLAVSRKGGIEDLTSAQRQRLADFASDARVINEYFEKRLHRDSGRGQLRTPEMKKLYPEIDNPGDFDHYAERRQREHTAFDSALFPELGENAYVVGVVSAGPHELLRLYVRGDGLAAAVVSVEPSTLNERLIEESREAGWSHGWASVLGSAAEYADNTWNWERSAASADKRKFFLASQVEALRLVAERRLALADARTAQLAAAETSAQAQAAIDAAAAAIAQSTDDWKRINQEAAQAGFDLAEAADAEPSMNWRELVARLDVGLHALHDVQDAGRKRLRAFLQAEGDQAIRSLGQNAPTAERVAARMKQAGHDWDGARLAEAIEAKDVEWLRDLLGNLENRASRAAFGDVTGIKLAGSRDQTRQQIDAWAGILPEERARREAAKLAERQADARKAALSDAWRAIATVNVREGGKSQSLHNVVVAMAGRGQTEIRALNRGAATQYGLARPGENASFVKLKSFNTFLKAASAYGDLKAALAVLGVAVPEAAPAAAGQTTAAPQELSLRTRGADALLAIKNFLSAQQRRVIADAMKTEEGDWFAQKMIELRALIEGMPVTYEQDGKGDQAVVYLHYFKGSADWWVTEKDKAGGVDQAFGLADIFGDGGELGYISIREITASGAELDLHWAPKPLAMVRRGSSDDELEAGVLAERISGDLKNHGGFALTINGVRRVFVGQEPEDLTDRASDLAAGQGIPMNEAIAQLAMREGWDKRDAMPGPAPVTTTQAATPEPSGDAAASEASATLKQIIAGTHPRMLEPELADEIERVMTAFPNDAMVQDLANQAIVAYSNGLMAATG